MLIVSTKDAAQFFRVSERTVQHWGSQGAPKAGRGKWDLQLLHEWWLERIYNQAEDTEALNNVKLEYWGHRARREKVAADEAEKDSIKKADVVDSWAWRVAEVSAGLGAVAMRLAPLVAGKGVMECRKILDKEMWAIRDRFARTGKFTPAVASKKKPKRKKKK